MNRRYPTLKTIVRFTFILSLFLLLFSIWQMITADMKVKANLRQWEILKEEREEKEEVRSLSDDLRIAPLLTLEAETPHLPSTVPTLVQQEARSDAAELFEVKAEVPEPPLYNYVPTKGELIGTIAIPALDKELPIIHGTDSKQLAEGVGHYIGSALPGEDNNSVLAGHRDTVFRGLGEVKIGDQVQIETIAGVFTYEIVKQQIVEKDDRTIIVSSEDPILTIVTCYPFDYVGPAPQRYILTGKLIDLERSPH